MGTKTEPGKYDCYKSAEADEPIFVLLARDPLAPALVRQWATNRASVTGLSDKVIEALKAADQMDEWRAKNCSTGQPTISARCEPESLVAE